MSRMQGNAAIKRLRTISTSDVEQENLATRQGVFVKTLIFAVIALLSALMGFVILEVVGLVSESGFSVMIGILIGSMIVAFIAAMVASFKIESAPISGTIYAVFEGLVLGIISAIVEYVYPGIAFAALLSTAAVFAVMATLYYTGVVKVGQKFRSFMLTALFGIVVTQLLLWVVSMFNPAIGETIYGDGAIGIIISVFMVIFASFMLLFDFSTIDIMIANGMDKKYEWYGAFSLLVTLVWLYMRILNLLLRLASRSRR